MNKLKAVLPSTGDMSETVYLVLTADGDETDLYTEHGGIRHARIASVSPKGLRRATHVPADLGFPLDSLGRIKLDE